MKKSLKKIALVASLVAGAALTFNAHALNVNGSSSQFAGGFNPGVGYGGFGGGNCSASKTPVIFVHGNGDNAINWDTAPSGPYKSSDGRSVYDYFKARGYNDCELFGITYLSSSQQKNAGGNYHSSSKYNMINTFIDKVKAYTGKSKVDIVGHSLGVSMSLATLEYKGKWSSVRRFINIAGGIRGLASCLYTGYANPIAATCGSQNIYSSYTFGFYPSTGIYYYGYNQWTGSSGSKSMRRMPSKYSNVNFYTIHAGYQDEVHCGTLQGWSNCSIGAEFNNYSNVKAQLNIGTGSTARQYDFNFEDYSIYNLFGGDKDGIGHMRAKNNAGDIIYQMLTSNCSGDSCVGNYNGPLN